MNKESILKIFDKFKTQDSTENGIETLPLIMEWEFNDLATALVNHCTLTPVSDLFISAEYLRELHPELTPNESESLNQFCNDNTIRYKECYGRGGIMYPKWKEINKH